jgi:hypothetical protein
VASRVQIDQDAMANVDAAVQQLFETRLGPDIARDAARYAPEHTGALRASVEHHLENGSLIVSASGGAGGRIYAAWVELGHRVYHPSTGITGPEVVAPRPFLRPALFQERSG